MHHNLAICVRKIYWKMVSLLFDSFLLIIIFYCLFPCCCYVLHFEYWKLYTSLKLPVSWHSGRHCNYGNRVIVHAQ